MRQHPYEHRLGPLSQEISEPGGALYCLDTHLVVYDHHVVAVGGQPRVHGFADAADFVQSRSMVVRPAEIYDLGPRTGKGRQRARVGEGERERAGEVGTDAGTRGKSGKKNPQLPLD